MNRLVLTLAALGAATSLAACSKKEAATKEAAAPPAAPASDMAAMAMAAEAKMAKGTGTVTAVGADSVTVDHAAIPEANWPAMTMAFKASPEIAKSVMAGDKVAFDLKVQGGGGEIIAIRKQ
ncbi:copper-binding protein [Phenylobacterium sp.]|uniref:copper-binding protein n=1 Tax=Phenylobacterium sp. TaxID=1871053 RepID=UPI002EDBAF55